MIKLIVGLGNPGSQYEYTRHNAGFIFLDELAGRFGCNWSVSAQFQAEIAECSWFGNKLVLIKPATFMNRSGMSVAKVMHYYKIRSEELLVVHDELELAESVVRLKKDGGHAGHNGLRDIIASTGSRDFFRLRLGIGRPSEGANIANYVLSKFSVDGRARFEDMCAKILTKFEFIVSGDLELVNKILSD